MARSWLQERMAEWPDQPAIVWHDRSFTFATMIELIQGWHRALDEHGVGAGQVVALEGDYSPESCSLLVALTERGAVAVPLSGVSAAERGEFLDIAEVQAVVTFGDEGQWAIEKRPVQVTHQLTKDLIASGSPGLVLFSSGSTGKSKAALHDFGPLLEKYKVRRPALRTISFLLLDHIGGINTLFHVLSNGGTVVSVAARDPDTVCAAIARHAVELLPTSPTFLNLLLLSEAYMRHDLSSLKLATYGTEPMPESTLARLAEVLPNVRLQQTYGLSEVGILRSKSKDSKSLWVKVGGEGFETKIVDSVLWIRSRSAMLGYLNAPSPFDAEGWMNTQDMVEVDGEYIRILGRKTDIINVGGQKVYPAEVESTLLQMPNVKDVTVFGEKNPITGQVVVARIALNEDEPLPDLKKRMRAFCRDKLQPFKVPVKVELTDRAEHNARFKKIRRPRDS
ncbi:MAG TPA: fatty acid--CoA ligase family protein [Candidatus Binatia bacterium]|jgi:acyl-coenzyme A synthetase/AMP-(fatty) acid ligase|nr:fatty acid--CoA ligase family protein [Candidatus Binatia bacterium]